MAAQLHVPIRIAIAQDIDAVLAHLERFEVPWRKGREPIPYGPHTRQPTHSGVVTWTFGRGR